MGFIKRHRKKVIFLGIVLTVMLVLQRIFGSELVMMVLILVLLIALILGLAGALFRYAGRRFGYRWAASGTVALILGLFAFGYVQTEDFRAPKYPPVYRPGFGAMNITLGMKKAIKEFPDVSSCLKSNAAELATEAVPALYHIDWDEIDTDDDAKVCLFRIFSDLRSPEAVMEWLRYQGFRAEGPIWQRGGGSLMLQFGFDLRARMPGVGGSWSLKDGQFPKYPTSGLWRYFVRLRAYSQRVGVKWFPDGMLMRVSVSYPSK